MPRMNQEPKPPKTRVLTARQADLLDFLLDFTLDHGYQPSIREIGQEFGIRSPNGVECHLNGLERKGYIRRTGGARAIEIVGGLRT